MRVRVYNFESEFVTTAFTKQLRKYRIGFSRINNRVKVYIPDWETSRRANKLAVEATLESF